MVKAKLRSDIAAYECTINLHKRLYGISFKKRAPRAISEVKKYAEKMLKTSDVRIDESLNRFLWSKGIRSLPPRVRVRLERKRSDDESSKEKLYTLVTYVPTTNFHELVNEKVE